MAIRLDASGRLCRRSVAADHHPGARRALGEAEADLRGAASRSETIFIRTDEQSATWRNDFVTSRQFCCGHIQENRPYPSHNSARGLDSLQDRQRGQGDRRVSPGAPSKQRDAKGADRLPATCRRRKKERNGRAGPGSRSHPPRFEGGPKGSAFGPPVNQNESLFVHADLRCTNFYPLSDRLPAEG